jgi:prepilin signal peptidase PulO-like enzyme (type II secretory pathway)
MGMGDLKLILALALVFGWPEISLIMAFSFILGSFYGVFLIIKGRKKMKDAVPFGPFIALSAVIIFFLGYNIIDMYFKLFKIY